MFFVQTFVSKKVIIRSSYDGNLQKPIEA